MKNKKNPPLVSVVMPVYNTQEYVGEAIESILDQTFTDFEFIIIDDGSTDSTWDIIQQYANTDDRIKAYQNIENMRICKTLNRGIELSSGIFIARMDADDISMVNRFGKQVAFLEKNTNCDIVGSSIILIDEMGSRVKVRSYLESFYPTLLIESPTAHPSTMFRKKIIDKIGGYDNEFVYAEDYDLWMRAYHAGFSGHNIKEPLLKYRMSSGSTKIKNLKKQLSQTIAVKNHAIKKGYISISCFFVLRYILDNILLLVPSKIVYYIFRLYKG